MSFVKKQTAQPVNSQFKLQLMPNPKNCFDRSNLAQQQQAIADVTILSKGLFVPNQAVKHEGAIKCGQFYQAGIPLSKLADVMKNNDLVMSVSLCGEHKACAMATADDLLENNVVTSPSGSFSFGVQGGFLRHVDFL